MVGKLLLLLYVLVWGSVLLFGAAAVFGYVVEPMVCGPDLTCY